MKVIMTFTMKEIFIINFGGFLMRIGIHSVVPHGFWLFPTKLRSKAPVAVTNVLGSCDGKPALDTHGGLN